MHYAQTCNPEFMLNLTCKMFFKWKMCHSFSTTFIFAPLFVLKGHKSKTLLAFCIFDLFSSQTPNLQILKVCVLERNIVCVERVEQCVRKVLVDVRNCYEKRVQNRYYTRL